MLNKNEAIDIESLLAKAEKPSADAMKLHPFYRGKVETALKCTVRDFNDFAIWYTPGVAAPCRAIAENPEKVYEYTNKWNTVAVVSDGTRVLGLGDIGPKAHEWIDFLANAGCGLWQVLPLGPTGYGDSPYQCFSAFAGNPYLISPEALQKDGLLSKTELQTYPQFPDEQVDYGRVIPQKMNLLQLVYENFNRSSFPACPLSEG